LFLEVEKISREPIKSAKQFIYAAAADQKIAEEMDIPVGSPVLVKKSIYCIESGRPLLVAFTYFPCDSFQLVSVLERR
jgi:DNA-binding GntR family transcriptional regulator